MSYLIGVISLSFVFLFQVAKSVESSQNSKNLDNIIISVVVPLITLFVVQFLTPVVKKWLGLGHDFKTSELQAAIDLRKDWQREVAKSRALNDKLQKKCDELESKLDMQEKTIYHQEYEIERLKRVNEVLMHAIEKHGIKIEGIN